MQFGKKKKDSTLDIDSYGDQQLYLRNFDKGDTLIRFLDDHDDWIEFWEHYYNKQAFPCTEDRNSCPGCTSDDPDVRKRGLKYAANVYLVEKKLVLPFRIPITLARKFFNRAGKNKNNTVMDNDWLIMRTGEKLNTEYDVDKEDAYQLDVTEFTDKMFDIPAVLKEMYNSVWQDSKTKDDADDDDTDDKVYTQAELEAMTKLELIEICVDEGIEYEQSDTKREILNRLLSDKDVDA